MSRYFLLNNGASLLSKVSEFSKSFYLWLCVRNLVSRDDTKVSAVLICLRSFFFAPGVRGTLNQFLSFLCGKGSSAKWMGFENARPKRPPIFAALRKPMLYKRHFLIVEDDDAVMLLLLEQLAHAFGRRSHLECTSSPSIACESLAYTEFDAILFDFSLANHRTNTVVTTIRSRAPRTPLFLLLDKGCPLQEVEPFLVKPSGCFFKHELKERAWLGRFCAAVARRN